MVHTFKKTIINIHEIARSLISLLDFTLWLFIDPSKFKKIKNQKIKKILVVLINQEKGNIGGDFCTLGVLNYFLKIFPNIELSIFTDKKTEKQMGKNSKIKFIEYKGENSLVKLKKQNFQAGIFLNLGKLSPRNFLFIPYRISKSSNSFLSFFKIKNKFFITRKTHLPFGIHMVELRFKMLESLGFKFKNKKLIFENTKEEIKKIDSFNKKEKIKKFIILHPGGKYVAESYNEGKWPPHLWNLDRYAKVADYFIKKGYKILITGSKEESYLTKEIKKYSKNKKQILDVCGNFSIKEIGALLKKSSLLISTDTSIVHIAYQEPINAKIVELMGPSIPEVVGAWPPNNPNHKILIDKGPYSRSMRKIPFKNNFNCLEKITVKEVIISAEKLLKK